MIWVLWLFFVSWCVHLSLSVQCSTSTLVWLVLLLHYAAILSQVRPDVVLLSQGLQLPRRLRRAPTVAPRRLVLVAPQLHVQQLEMVPFHAHLLDAPNLVVHGVEAPEPVAAAGLILLVVAWLHRVGKQDFSPDIEPCIRLFNVLLESWEALGWKLSIIPISLNKHT